MSESREVADDQHGSTTGYSYGCRCTECTAANADGWRRWKDLRMRRLEDAPHGKGSTYTNWGCRCAECKEAHRIVNREGRNNNGKYR